MKNSVYLYLNTYGGEYRTAIIFNNEYRPFMPQFCGGMKILINYADDKYKKTQQFNSWTEKHIGGFGKIIEYGPQDIVSEYRESYKEIFEVASGNGLWLRKSYFVLRTLNASKYDNNIFYSESGRAHS